MTIKDESFDLIREKQELDIFLSSITDNLPSDGVEQEKPAVIQKVQEELTGSDHNEPRDLAREKQDVDTLLSGITSLRLPDEIIKEQQPVAAREEIGLPVFGDDVSKHAEPESKGSAEKEERIPDRVEQNDLAEATEIEEKQTILRDAKPEEKKLGDTGIKTEKQPPKEERIIKDKTAVVKESKKNLWGTRIRMIGLFVVFIIIAQGYLWLYPDTGHQTIEWMRSNIPLINQLLGEEKNERDIIINQIEFINVRQRFVQNESLGTLRIIEGTLVNQADFPLTKVKVMGELFDSQGRLLAARVSPCGNMLSDEALGRLKEEEIRLLSSITREDKILPKGQIPFMIVFKRGPAAVAKATVMAIEAKRLSP